MIALVSDAIEEYAQRHTAAESPVFQGLAKETYAKTKAPQMQVGRLEGAFLRLLVRLTRAERVLEIGTFTGYSALCVASAMPEDGRLIACDISEEWTNVARRYWREAGVDHKIDLRLAPAAETLAELMAEGRSDSFDFAFIDADKAGYPGYYEQCLTLLRSGGLLAVDNALWGGRVADETANDAHTVTIRELTLKARDDERVTASLIPIGDGLLLVRKRKTK